MPTAAAPRPAKAERTRAAILAAAESLFARRGYAATRLEDVAEAVGVKRAALFYHFRDKQALIAQAQAAMPSRHSPVRLASGPERSYRPAPAWVSMTRNAAGFSFR